jgi:hypothetical protein
VSLPASCLPPACLLPASCLPPAYLLPTSPRCSAIASRDRLASRSREPASSRRLREGASKLGKLPPRITTTDHRLAGTVHWLALRLHLLALALAPARPGSSPCPALAPSKRSSPPPPPAQSSPAQHSRVQCSTTQHNTTQPSPAQLQLPSPTRLAQFNSCLT